MTTFCIDEPRDGTVERSLFESTRISLEVVNNNRGEWF